MSKIENLMFELLINYIEKLQKENEKLKEKIKEYEMEK